MPELTSGNVHCEVLYPHRKFSGRRLMRVRNTKTRDYQRTSIGSNQQIQIGFSLNPTLEIEEKLPSNLDQSIRVLKRGFGDEFSVDAVVGCNPLSCLLFGQA